MRSRSSKQNLRRVVAVCCFAALAVNSSPSAFAANGSVAYTYDALGRLTTTSYDTGVLIIYTYDANGNRTSQTINVNSATGVWGSFNWGSALWKP